jgi:prolyl oligopeptidase
MLIGMRHCIWRSVELGLVLCVGIVASAQTLPQTVPQTIHGREGILLPASPVADAIPVTDDYSGTKIPDNYRWLEDAKSAETRAFIETQNAYTDRYMHEAKMRPDVVDDLDALEHVSGWTLPIERNGNYFFEKRLAGEEEASIYLRRGWAGKDERLIDPARLTRDANISIQLLDVSRDGLQVAYALHEGGAEEATIHVAQVKTGKTLEDELPSAVYRSVNFTVDGKGLYYSRAGQAGTLLYQHQLGTRLSRDTLLFGREFYDEPLGPTDPFHSWVTDDGRYLVVEIDRGLPARRVDIVFRDLKKPASPFQILIWGQDARFKAIWVRGAWIVETDYQAPKGRVLEADPGILPDVWKTLVPEGLTPIENFSVVGGKIYLTRLMDGKPENTAYTLDGKPAGKLDQDGFGTVSPVAGAAEARYGFQSFESLLTPPVVYRLDTMTGKREVFGQTKIAFDAAQFEVKQVFIKSKDGTQIPLWIAGKKGLKQDGTERLLMAGSGGFGVSQLPRWSPLFAEWLGQGGWLVLPSLRGGGEYGENWHRQAIFGDKQKTFDDWYAAAEYLIAEKYTSAGHLAILGSGVGGLLVGASITQRTELFSAAVCADPLLDMLRYQKFGNGAQWTGEFGSAEKDKQFFYLLKYSPYHNVTAKAAYPAVLFTTSDSGAWADPLHARKMTALLQSASSSGRPILLREPTAGDGLIAEDSLRAPEKTILPSVDRQMQLDADQLTFLWTETGLTPVAR